MSTATIVAGAVQVVGAGLAPLLHGTVQQLKARLQGRPGSSPTQPFRELRRLWGKSTVAPVHASAVYRSAPAVVATCLALALLLVPIAGVSPRWPLGNDALVVLGLLALARLAIAAAAWDTGSGFALMGASRDVSFAVSIEAVLLLVVLLAALPVGSTDLVVMSDAAAGLPAWRAPEHWFAGLAFLIAAVAEAGRQPVDNPDTHLELTMVHEGPLLEYAGREQALLQWAAAARLWLMGLLAGALFLPQGGGFGARLAALAAGLLALAVALALLETALAKMRILRVPQVLAGAAALCLLGLAAWVGGVVA